MNTPSLVRDILDKLPQAMDVDWPERLLPCAICRQLIQVDDAFFVVFMVDGHVTAQIHFTCKES